MAVIVKLKEEVYRSWFLRLAAVVCLLTGFHAGVADAMEIFVKTQKQVTVTLDVAPDDTIEKVKAKIYEKTGIPASNQSLVFGGKVLEGGRRLSDYKVWSGYTLMLAVLKPDLKPKLSSWVFTGAKVNMAISGGIPPYIYTVSTNKSGAKISGDGIYTAGKKFGVTDIVRITDATGRFLEANVEVVAVLKNLEPPTVEPKGPKDPKGPKGHKEPKVNEPLICDPGKWNDPDAKLTVRWLVDGKVIPNATEWEYTPMPEHAGRKITCEVTAVNRKKPVKEEAPPVEPKEDKKPYIPPSEPTTTETLKFTGLREDKKAYIPPSEPTTTETLKFTGLREDKKAYIPPSEPTTTETLKFTGLREDKKAYIPPSEPTTTETLKFTGLREEKKAYDPPGGPTTTETLKFTGLREDKKPYIPPSEPTTTETLKFTGLREEKKAYIPPSEPTTTETLKFTGLREDKKAYIPPSEPTTTETLKFTGLREEKKAYDPPSGPTTTEPLKFTGLREDEKPYIPPAEPVTPKVQPLSLTLTPEEGKGGVLSTSATVTSDE